MHCVYISAKDLVVGVYNVTTGSRWFSFNWNLSEPRCVVATTKLMLRVTHSYPTYSTYSFAVPKSCTESKELESLNCLVNITSVNGSTSPSPCTSYATHVYPQIWDIDYPQYNSTEVTAKTIPGTKR